MISACLRATAVSLALRAVELPSAVQILTDIPLVEAGEAELVFRDGMELRAGDEDAAREERELEAVVGSFAGGRAHEVGDGVFVGVGRGDVVRAGRAEAVGGVDEAGQPAGEVNDTAGGAGLALENGVLGGARIGGGPDAGVGRDGFAGGIAVGDADPVFQPVLAVAEGADDTVFPEVKLGRRPCRRWCRDPRSRCCPARG